MPWQPDRSPVAVRWNVTHVTWADAREHGVRGAPVVRFAAMEFRILVPLQVFDDAQPLALGGPKQRGVLAHLILRLNHTVSADRRPTAT